MRAKGYHPKVIVTDLRQDYGPLIAQVFPQARHHECIFHALKDIEEHFQEVYGAGYGEAHPEALKQEIYHIFDARTKRTAQKRYEKVMALRERYVQETPAAGAIFDFLERHWPTLGARLFLGVFEKVYRFTPFSQDAQPRIRGQCPLELAGYDISQVPMASLCAGFSLAWPLEATQNPVPNS